MKLQWHNEKRRIADLILWDKNPRLLSDEQRQIREALNGMIRLHNRKSKHELHDEESDAISGLSWKQLCVLALRGDLKGRRKEQVTNKSDGTRNKRGITFEQALRDDERFCPGGNGCY